MARNDKESEQRGKEIGESSADRKYIGSVKIGKSDLALPWKFVGVRGPRGIWRFGAGIDNPPDTLVVAYLFLGMPFTKNLFMQDKRG
jgi:hypothetical protein